MIDIKLSIDYFCSNFDHFVKAVAIIVFALCILAIVVMRWHSRRRRHAVMGNGRGKYCEKAKYIECPVKEEEKTSSKIETHGTLVSLAHDTGDEYRHIVGNLVTATVEDVPRKLERPHAQIEDVPRPFADTSNHDAVELICFIQESASQTNHFSANDE